MLTEMIILCILNKWIIYTLLLKEFFYQTYRCDAHTILACVHVFNR